MHEYVMILYVYLCGFLAAVVFTQGVSIQARLFSFNRGVSISVCACVVLINADIS